METVLTVLLAGGKGTRLEPLTRDRAKPAAPFGGVYRIVDFALSNCVNSRQMRILILTQYKSLSLESHVSRNWHRFFHAEFGQALEIASPQQRVSEDWYLGTANAVYQNIYSIEKSGADLVLVLAADHIYKMDYRPMLDFHRRHGGAGTVASLRCAVGEAAERFGVVEVDDRSQVIGFAEKPARPAPLPGDEDYCLASMGIYVFTASFLVNELRRSAEGADPAHDFGQHFVPRIIGREAVHAFMFPGPGAGAGGYWRDVGTVDAYYEANMDLLGDRPGLDLYDRAWPIYSSQVSSPPPRVTVAAEPGGRATAGLRHNIFSNGTLCEGWVRGSVVGFNCRIERDAIVEDSILYEGVSVGRRAEVRRVILDEGVHVEPGARIGVDPNEDRARGYMVSERGVTCVPADTVVDGPPAHALGR